MNGPALDAGAWPIFETGALFETHPLAHIIYDVEHLRLLAANQAAVDRYGYSRKELLNLNRLDLLLGSDRAVAKISIADLRHNPLHATRWICRERSREGQVLHSDTRGVTGLYQGRPARLVAVLDANQREETEAEADQSRELLTAASRLAQVGAWSVDLKSNRVFWSDVVCEIHEVTPGFECKLDEAISFYPGEAALIMRRAVKRCLDESVAFDLELPFKGAKGSPRWVRATGEAVCDSAGRVIQLRGALQDTTRSKRAETELQESRVRLAATLRAIPDLWFILDREGRYLEVSSTDHPSLPVAWEQVIGRKFMDMEGVPQELKNLSMKAMQQLAATGLQQTIRYERETLRAGRRAFEARIVPMFGGRILYLTRDVTELQNAQRKLEGILKAIPDLWFVIDGENRFVDVSSRDDPRLIRPWSEVSGRHFDEVLSGELAGVGMDLINACRETGEVQATEYSMAVSAGVTMNFEARFVPMEARRVYLLIRGMGPAARQSASAIE